MAWYHAQHLRTRFGAFLFFMFLIPIATAKTIIDFNQLYGSFSPLGLEFSDRVKENVGKEVVIKGFMAPPLKAEAQFFVLTKMPMSICPFCSTDADWPTDIVVIYLKKKQTFTQYNQQIEVEGRLETGSWTDPDTGFVSQLRLRDATFTAL
ncbi:hypothetical protein L0B52_08575 [Suttonella sp. R2A3]|nr:hypothetical protein [Suttonella sp. R2A3]UJF24378.1 hypothetical protein L0B52_08575 [Suttonella sp. R2A3]